MASRNDITGDEIRSKATTDEYRDSWERTFGKNKMKPVDDDDEDEELKQDDLYPQTS